MKKAMLLALAVVTAIGLTACGGGSKEPAAEAKSTAAESKTETAAPAETEEGGNSTEPAAEADLSTPSIVIALGDVDGIIALGKQMQNFEIAEGTVIQITGLYEKPGSTGSIMESNEAGDAKNGISIFLADGVEEPADDTIIEATGVAVKGQYNMEFHVSADGLKVIG